MESNKRVQRGQIYLINMQGLTDFADRDGNIKNRPGLVISNDFISSKNHTVTVALLTRQYKTSYIFVGSVNVDDSPSYVKYERIITIPRRRLLRCLKSLDESELPALDMHLMSGIGLSQYTMFDIVDFEISGILECSEDPSVTKILIDFITFSNTRWSTYITLEAFRKVYPDFDSIWDFDKMHDLLNNCFGLHFLFSSFCDHRLEVKEELDTAAQ